MVRSSHTFDSNRRSQSWDKSNIASSANRAFHGGVPKFQIKLGRYLSHRYDDEHLDRRLLPYGLHRFDIKLSQIIGRDLLLFPFLVFNRQRAGGRGRGCGRLTGSIVEINTSLVEEVESLDDISICDAVGVWDVVPSLFAHGESCECSVDSRSSITP